MIFEKYKKWQEEGSVFQDPRILWDLIKYKIRYETIAFSKKKARKGKEILSALEKNVKECASKCDEDPTHENVNDLEFLQSEYVRHYEYFTQEAIIRSRANWYELGEKNNNYFLKLENSKKKKSGIRKLVTTRREGASLG